MSATFARFSDAARAVMNRALEESSQRRTRGVGREHILLGLLKSEDDALAGLFHSLKVDVPGLVGDLDRSLRPGFRLFRRVRPGDGAASKSAIETAVNAALEFNDGLVDPVCLLLGAVEGEESGAISKSLRDRGLDAGKVRAALAGDGSDS